jgi:hypothetical protein
LCDLIAIAFLGLLGKNPDDFPEHADHSPANQGVVTQWRMASLQRFAGSADFNLPCRGIYSSSAFEVFGASGLWRACRLKSALQQNEFCATGA